MSQWHADPSQHLDAIVIASKARRCAQTDDTGLQCYESKLRRFSSLVTTHIHDNTLSIHRDCPNLLITIGAAVRDSYVVLKDSRMLISSRTIELSEDHSAVSSSRSAVISCKTERGKRHVYLKRIGRKFHYPRLRIIGSGIRMHMLVPERGLQVAKESQKLQILTGQDSISIAKQSGL